MKNLFLMLFLSLSINSAFAKNGFNFYVTEVHCNAAPDYLRFNLSPIDIQGNFRGHGGEHYLTFDLDCKTSADKETIRCTSDQEGSALISMDQDGIVTAKFTGRYFKDKKIGCVVGM